MAAAATDNQAIAPRTLAAAMLTPRVRHALDNQMKTAFSDLEGTLSVVVMETVQQLGLQREQSSLPQLQIVAFESVRMLRSAEPGLVACCLRELEMGLANLNAPRGSRRLEYVVAPTEGLTLVEEFENNEGGLLANIALRADLRNSLALQLMGYRYGVLAGAPAFDAEHLPLGPHALCHALRDAAHAAVLSADVRLLLYKQFEKVVMPLYPTLLDTLNARLAEDGILPHLSFVPLRLRPASDPDAGASHGVGNETPAQQASGPAGKANPGAQSSGYGLADAGQETGSPRPRLDSFGNLQELLARRRMLLAKLRSGGTDERVREPLAREEVLESLRRLRSSSTKPGSVTEIRQSLLAQARQMHGHGVALTEADSDSFELFNLFMAQLQREMRDGPAATLVERLKLPLMQLGLREHRFFVDATHPARMLLDAVSLAGAQWLGDDDVDAQWLGLLQRAVATVQEDPDANHDTFVTANHALQGGLVASARKNEMAERRQVEAARGREKLDLARQRATSEITRLVRGRTLPRYHAVLLEQAWADVLSLTLLRHGEDSGAWRELQDVTASIVEAGIPQGSRQIDLAFVGRLQELLGQVGYHAEDAYAIAYQLANGRVDEDDLASRTEVILQLKARARLGGAETPLKAVASPRTKWEDEAYAMLASLTSACWLDITNPAEERTIRRRLAWVSQRSGHALILNRRGLRVANDDLDSLDSLARRLAVGQLQVVEVDKHPAEAAWQTIFARLARIADDASAKGARS